MAIENPEAPSHWVQWHSAYEDPQSPLSTRLRLAQAAIRAALVEALHQPPHQPPHQPLHQPLHQPPVDAPPRREIRIVSICAGQGRDVIDVVAELAGEGEGEGGIKGADVRCLLVEFDPALVEFARHRVTEAGLGSGKGAVIEVVEGDASLTHHYSGHLPADVVVICGVFGNISDADIHRTIDMLPPWCAPGGSVVWTRHRRDPDLTPAIRAWFADAGFEEASFESPPGFVLSVGRHRRLPNARPTTPFDPAARLFTFVGDGSLPA